MVFIKEPSLGDIHEFDYECAIKLRAALSKKGLCQRHVSIKAWAKHFRAMRMIDKLKKKRIRQALEWYMPRASITTKYMPQAFSAKGFRQRFIKIEAAMIREAGFKPIKKISPEAKRISERLSKRHWPKGSKDQLESAVQVSLEEYDRFIKQVRDWTIKCLFMRKSEFTPYKRIFRFAVYLKEQKLPSPEGFVERWFLEVNETVRDWDGWNGDLMKRAFAFDSVKFRRMGQEWAEQYGNDPSRWDKLMELIKHEGS